MRKTCAAVIVAAGSASRMKGIDKILEPVGGLPMIRRTAEAFRQSAWIDRIVIVTREDLIDTIRNLCPYAEVVRGGSSRAESVMLGIRAVPDDMELIAIHDGARPLVSQEIIQRTVQAARMCDAAAPAVAVHDTIKVAHNGIVTETPDRSTLYAVQTPQVFAAGLIRNALSEGLRKKLPLTDDCSAVEAAGIPVTLVAGEEENLKVTTPIDIVLAEAILKGRNEA